MRIEEHPILGTYQKGKTVTFTLDGKEMQGCEGEPIAAALKAAGVALACLIAFSRLYLYVHYPSDILVGAVVGAAVGVLSVRLVLWLWPEKTPS